MPSSPSTAGETSDSLHLPWQVNCLGMRVVSGHVHGCGRSGFFRDSFESVEDSGTVPVGISSSVLPSPDPLRGRAGVPRGTCGPWGVRPAVWRPKTLSASLGLVSTRRLSWGFQRPSLHRRKPATSTPASFPRLPGSWSLRLQAATLGVLFRLRGFSPPGRFAPSPIPRVCCTPLPILGFTVFRSGPPCLATQRFLSSTMLHPSKFFPRQQPSALSDSSPPAVSRPRMGRLQGFVPLGEFVASASCCHDAKPVTPLGFSFPSFDVDCRGLFGTVPGDGAWRPFAILWGSSPYAPSKQNLGIWHLFRDPRQGLHARRLRPGMGLAGSRTGFTGDLELSPSLAGGGVAFQYRNPHFRPAGITQPFWKGKHPEGPFRGACRRRFHRSGFGSNNIPEDGQPVSRRRTCCVSARSQGVNPVAHGHPRTSRRE
jgi:hypothetical protein